MFDEPAPRTVAIGGRSYVVGRRYLPTSNMMRGAKRLLGFESGDPRWPGGRVVYKTDAARRPAVCSGEWWAGEMRREARD